MNVAVFGCKNIKDKTCIGCHRCLMAFDRKEGEFERYKDNEQVSMRALMDCGGCPGSACINRLFALKGWMSLKDEGIDAIHIATCLINGCPHKDTIISKIKEKAGVPVVLGTHPYVPPTVFG